jgi:aryl-alcohol dehydrogenase-like predicted oxidoreductase
MDKVVLGKTQLEVNKNGFGVLPLQRIAKADAVCILQKAFYNGINYYDTARNYTDSEEKVGAAFYNIRDKLVISTKTAAVGAENFWKDLEQSLRNLRTDYIDIYQLHNPDFCPKPGDPSGLYDAMLEARRRERSGLSASRTTGCPSPPRLFNRVCMIRSSSPSAICRPTRT